MLQCKWMIALLVVLQAGIVQAKAQAQPYPSRFVRIVVGFAPGGGTDIVARLLAQKLSESLGQTFVVENKAGATGTVGAAFVATSPADGHTLLMGHVNSNAIAPALMSRPPYDPVKDFAPVAYIGFVPNVLVVNPETPAKTVAELVALSKSRSNGVSFASPGVGSTNQLAGEMLRIESGGKFLHIPYKGSGPAIVDLLAGHVDMNFDALSSVTAYLKSGQMRALAVTTPQRDPGLPDVPTMAELGFQRLKITNWYGVMAPAGTPPDVLNKLHDEIYRIVQLPDVAQKLAELGLRHEPMSIEQFAQFIRAEAENYREIGKISGVQMN
ncbi:tripartite tricarboxylate transporter substrate binding protein [Bradyrhizobium sp. LHD-71]|uniref:Bug family tripartite tricarboxylate transporter substrate binding protein n=1 Tax=Bradyrhizobium sp. LHD-71 TaxID=3072141 RepID=UPI00280F80BF|nr:tripartite tricarboxylate transporter substrate binding protein [Bradyrhizobium sp. LHD-71]MDQ8732187.1 tripartite tricarboxylate transporter substrate binding protein [Bradyrhizobium sp. LHD-71]